MECGGSKQTDKIYPLRQPIQQNTLRIILVGNETDHLGMRLKESTT